MNYKNIIAYLILITTFIQVIYAQPINPSNEWPYFRGSYDGAGFSLSKAPSTFVKPRFIALGNEFILHDDPPIVYNKKVYVVTTNGSLICIDYVNGKILWKKDGDYGVPTVVGNRLYVIDHATLKCLDSNTGKEIWSKEGASRKFEVIVVEGKVIYAGRVSLNCSDAKTGKLLWSNMIVNICEPSYYKGKIYASGLGGLKCFNIDNGDIIWKRKDIGSWNTLALSDDKLIITFDKYVEKDTYIGSVIALNANTGKTL